MHTFFKIILAFLAVGCFSGCSSSSQDEKADEKAIRNIVQSYQQAYNQQDAAKLTKHWASNSTYLNPLTGEFADGKEAIENLFKKKFAQDQKRNLEVTIKSIDFPNSNEAIENGLMKVTIDNQSPQQMAYQAEYVKENGNWLIKALHEIELEEPFSNFDHLKDLAWLVGKWEDSDENVDIEFENQWDKNKNFIVQQFNMKIYGQDDIEGKQIIAWDPVKSGVRSWVFDSEGGFGEGTWEKVKESWYATMKFTLGDGSPASSINIYTPVNDHTYTFASIEREVDGEILPDMDPVTVEKIE